MSKHFLLLFMFVHAPMDANLLDGPRSVFGALKDAANLYFNGSDYGQWQSRPLCQSCYSKSILGYDCKLEYIEDATAADKSVTLYLHGWGDTKNSARLLKRFCGVLDANVVTFNFSDARPIIGKFRQSSFGQLSDVLSALFAVRNTIQALELDSLNLFGVSRGGATIINMLALLNDNELFVQNKKELERIGIDSAMRKKILQTIEQGTIILDVPLRSMADTPFPRFISRNFTAYDPQGLQPKETVKLLRGLKLKILIHFQHRDIIVSNKQEAEFFYYLAQYNPESTYLVMGNDGGHLHTHAALAKGLPVFKKTVWGNDTDKVCFIKDNRRIQNGVLTRFYQAELTDMISAFHGYHAHEFANSVIGRIKKILHF